MEIAIRPAIEADHALILDSSWRSIRMHPMAEDMSPAVITRLIGGFLKRWPCIVAADPETDTVLGWLLYRDPETVVWLWVKPWCRRSGVAKALLQHACISSRPELAFPTRDQIAGYAHRLRPYLTHE
jgi:ribosomal protein S18 acetylase RimI-like enzyme